jgi:phosphatidylcholine synthase
MPKRIPLKFLVHLWTLAGLGFAMLAAQRIVAGDLNSAARWLLLVLVVDHTDGTLARTLKLRDRFPRVSGEILDLVTDVVGLTFVPMLFCWRAGVFPAGWGAPLAVAASITCSYKYSMKSRILQEGYSLGAPPAFFSVLLFWILGLGQIWAALYTMGLIVMCWLPVRYPITSLVTTHWKPGIESVTNYLAFIAMIPGMLFLQKAPSIFFWPLLVLMLLHLYGTPLLMAAGVIRPGFRRVY